MPKTIKIPLGVGATIDGGPFFNFEAVRAEIHPEADAVFYGTDDEYTAGQIEAEVAHEMERGEPIQLSTGAVGPTARESEGASGTRDRKVAYIRLPLVIGFMVTINGEDETFRLENLVNYQRRRLVEQAIAQYGGEVTPT